MRPHRKLNNDQDGWSLTLLATASKVTMSSGSAMFDAMCDGGTDRKLCPCLKMSIHFGRFSHIDVLPCTYIMNMPTVCRTCL